MRFPRFVPLYVCLTLSTLHLLAQSPDGNMNGLVSDASSAAVVGAEVVAVNDVTGVQYTTKTNSEGIYVLPNLPPGPYRLQVSKLGFKTIIKPDIVLNIQDALSINFTLPVGATFEVMTVEGGAPLVNTESAAVSTVIDQTYVKDMPLNGRSFQDLILLTPGIVTQSPQAGAQLGQEGEFSVNGQRTESNYYTVDGVSANVGAAAGSNMINGAGPTGSLATSTALGTTQALVSVDDLQEFRVQSSTYSAEYGRNPGGQFAFETKSGTNQWHGTAYDYLRNGAVDAQDWFNDYFGLTEPSLRQNDFGGTLGGPVEIPRFYTGKDKTFFFVSYEGLRLTAPQAATVNYVPDLCMRGIGSCPSGRNPAPIALMPVVKAFPTPTVDSIDDPVNGIAQFIGSWSNPSSIDSTSVRFDHAVNDNLRFFFRFSDTASSSSTRGTYAPNGLTPSMNTTSTYIVRTYTAGVSSVFSIRLSNEFRLNYSSNEVRNQTVIDGFGGGTPVDLQQLTGLGPNSEPDVGLIYGPYGLQLFPQAETGSQRQWNLVDAVSVSSGRHHLKFGVDYRRLAPVAILANPNVDYIYLAENAVETNSPFAIAIAQAPAYPLYTNFSAFGQDEWRISPRLSLSLGLRWEVNPAPGVTQGLKPYTIQGTGPTTWALAPEGTPLWRTTWYNFAPRLGAAYILRNARGRETVIRGGGGVFYDTAQQAGSSGFKGPGFSATSYPPIAFPGSPAGLVPPIVNPPIPPYNSIVYGFAPHLQLPNTLQWNVSIEQALDSSEALTISYVGSHGARLLRDNQFSTPTNPNASSFLFTENGLTSDYNSLQAQLRRRLSRGLTALVSYTMSHCVDYGSQNYNYGYQRGNCDFDIRHNFSAAFSFDLPQVSHDGFLQAVLRGWGLDDRFTARTAFPVTLNGNPLLQPNGQYYYAGLNLVQGQPVYLYGSNCATILQGLGDLAPGRGCPGGRAINPLAFTVANSGLGDAPRNFTKGFGAWQMDLAVRRDFPLHERLKLQFRAEAFNLFNHPNFGTIDSTSGSPTFGQAIGTLASSLGILSPLYQQGGSRSMQFALKIVF
jgi:hypothetical protein